MVDGKLLVVVGATGTQGSSVISHFLKNEPGYRIRGLTRNTQSAKANALSEQGVEMVQADLNDLPSLEAAFKDATAIFAYTDFDGNAQSPQAAEIWSSGKTKTLTEAGGLLEIEQGKNLATAAAAIPTLERLVWSNTVDAEKLSQGKIKGVQELQGKAKIWEHIHTHPNLQDKASAVHFGVFANQIVRTPEIFSWTKLNPDSYKVRVSNSFKGPLAWIDLQSDGGSYVKALIDAPAGLAVEAVGGYLSYEEILSIIEKKLNIKIEFEQIPVSEYVGSDDTGIWEGVANLMLFVEEYGIGGGDKEVLTVDEFARRGYSVNRTNVRETLEAMDWSPLLQAGSA